MKKKTVDLKYSIQLSEMIHICECTCMPPGKLLQTFKNLFRCCAVVQVI